MSMSRVALIVILAALEGGVLWLSAGIPPTASPPGGTSRPGFASSPAPSSLVVRPSPSPSRDPESIRRANLERLSRQAETLRQRRFLRPVPTSEQSREEVRRYLERELDKDTDWRSEAARLEVFGFIPVGYPLRERMLDFYTQQVLGYYDPTSGAYHMVRDSSPGLASRALDVGWDMLQPGARLEQQETAMVHELDHALTDQHFGLEKAHEKAKKLKNTDAALAVQCLIEGDATVVMFHAQGEWMKDDCLDAASMANLQWFEELLAGPGFNRFPVYFRVASLFPYLSGAVFVDHYRFPRGWPAVDAMYRRLPASTEQILHPEKYQDAFDAPRAVAWPAAASVAPPGWRIAASDTMGEFQIRVMFESAGFSRPDASAWAAGWGGDSFKVLEPLTPGQPRYAVWVTAWDTEPGARRFESAIKRWAARPRGQDAGASRVAPPAGQSPAKGRATLIERSGRKVVLLLDVPRAEVPRCLGFARAARDMPFRAPGFAGSR